MKDQVRSAKIERTNKVSIETRRANRAVKVKRTTISLAQVLANLK